MTGAWEGCSLSDVLTWELSLANLRALQSCCQCALEVSLEPAACSLSANCPLHSGFIL